MENEGGEKLKRNRFRPLLLGVGKLFLGALFLVSAFLLSMIASPNHAHAATRTISPAGGNWDDPLAWTEGVVPTAADDVRATAASGNLTINVNAECLSFVMTGYTKTIHHDNVTLKTYYSAWTGSALNISPTTLTYTYDDGATFALQHQGAVSLGAKNIHTLTMLVDGTGSWFSGTGNVVNFTVTGAAGASERLLILSSNVNVTGTMTVAGSSVIERVTIRDNSLLSRTLTCANVSFANVDFVAMTGAGAADWDLSAIPGGSGNMGMNVGITFTPSAAQTWANANGGNWNDVANWSGAPSRVPLPQDDVSMATAFNPSKTVTYSGKVSYSGRDLNWTGATGNPTFNAQYFTCFGSLTLIPDMVANFGSSFQMYGENPKTLITAGHTIVPIFYTVFGTLTLGDALTVTNRIGLNSTVIDNSVGNYPVTFGAVTGAIKYGAATWTLTGQGMASGVILTGNASSVTTGSTIVISNATATAKTLAGNGQTFNNLTVSGDNVTITGNNTFTGTLAVNTAGLTNGLKLTAGSTQTIGNLTTNGSAGSLAKLVSATAGTPAYLYKTTGGVTINYMSLQDIGVATTSDGTSQYPPAQNDTYVKATTKWSTENWPYFVTDPTKSLIGTWNYTGWVSQNTKTTNQRFHIDLGSEKTINKIYYENLHNSGTVTNAGVKTFTLWGSNTAGDFADLTYANDGTWVQLSTSVSQFEQHTATNSPEAKFITVTNATPYRYYAFKFADNWGGASYMGVRRIELQTITNPTPWYYGPTTTMVSGNSGWTLETSLPVNPPTVSANVDGTPITAGSFINQAGNVNFTFSGSTDAETSVSGYYTYFGTDPAGVPSTYQAHSGAQGDDQFFNSSFTSAEDGKTLYFRVKTRDEVGNIGDATDVFTFGYDITLPTNPSFAAADPPGYTTVNSFDFSWPAGADPNGPGGSASGVKWYEYKRATDVAWSHTADAATRSVSGLTAYQEGANVFYVRSVDNATNIASTYQQVTYYWSGAAPAKPLNLAVTPDPAVANDLTVTWDKSVTGPGDPPVVGYYYSINAAPALNNVTYFASQDDHVSMGPDHFATQQGENTIYVLGVNQAGNYSFEAAYVASKTFNCQTPAPPAPVEVTIADSSDRANSLYSLTIVWSADPTQDPLTFDHYSIERATDGVTFAEIATTTNSTAYIDASGLDTNLTYSYLVRSVDNAASPSAASTIVSKQPIGNYQTPPTLLAAPTVGSITASSATIAWTTDRVSTSIVRYGTTDGTWDGSSGQFDSVQSHSVILNGLTAGSTYYFQVQSLDEFYDYAAEDAYSTSYDFATSDEPTITAVTVANITLTSADISFETTTVSTSEVSYGLTNAYGESVEDVSGATATKHNVKLTGLTTGTTYHFKITGTDVDGNLLNSDDYQFETLSLPRVENLVIKAIPGKAKSAFKATWTTNVPTSTILRYSDGGAWQETVNTKVETSHVVEVLDLRDNTTYSIVAAGRDDLGNLAESEVTEFTTPLDTRPANITDIVIETSMVGSGASVQAQVIVGFKTDEPVAAKVEYGTGTEGSFTGSTNEVSEASLERTVVISNLEPTSPYHLRIIAKDQVGNLTETESQSFITGEVRQSVWNLIRQVLSNVFGFLIKDFK